HNVRANPEVEIQIGRRRQAATARVIEPSEIRATDACGRSSTTTTTTGTPATSSRQAGPYRWSRSGPAPRHSRP
ncbi:MAG: nitroreductase family deazaflavin-dependent oxidoreductase, partial [Solirubrobacterales bacterium]|nr:nitroreductase family deazaflavin-dependent oxidoreductase [Solirubrobacterales bacterium]